MILWSSQDWNVIQRQIEILGTDHVHPLLEVASNSLDDIWNVLRVLEETAECYNSLERPDKEQKVRDLIEYIRERHRVSWDQRKSFPGAIPLGSRLASGREPLIFPGIRGILHDTPNRIIITDILSSGSGSMMEFLKSLPMEKTVVFSMSIQGWLRTLLTHNGYKRCGEDCMVKTAGRP